MKVFISFPVKASSSPIYSYSDASKCEAGHSGGGVGVDGHRLSAWRIWLLEERRGDVEGGRLCQSGGAGGRHTGEVYTQI